MRKKSGSTLESVYWCDFFAAQRLLSNDFFDRTVDLLRNARQNKYVSSLESTHSGSTVFKTLRVTKLILLGIYLVSSAANEVDLLTASLANAVIEL